MLRQMLVRSRTPSKSLSNEHDVGLASSLFADLFPCSGLHSVCTVLQLRHANSFFECMVSPCLRSKVRLGPPLPEISCIPGGCQVDLTWISCRTKPQQALDLNWVACDCSAAEAESQIAPVLKSSELAASFLANHTARIQLCLPAFPLFENEDEVSLSIMMWKRVTHCNA